MSSRARPRRPATPGPARVPRNPASRTAARRDEVALRREVVEACRRLRELDLIGGSEGNVSVRLEGDLVLITPAGADKGRLSEADLLVVDSAGRVARGRGRPSSELQMHLALYAACPESWAAVHAHPITAVATTVAGLPPPDHLVPEAVVVLGEIAVAPFATPGTSEVAASIQPLLARHQVILLERHGALTRGRTLAEAMGRMETLERVSRIALAARLLGRCEPLAPEAVAKVLAAAGRFVPR